MTLSATFDLDARGLLSRDDTISIVNDPVQSGQNSFPDMSVEITDGTGASQANRWYRSQQTLAAGANLDLDLAGGITDPFGATVTFTAVKWIILAVVSPDGAKSLRIGPQGLANAFQGPHGGVAAGNYVTVKYFQKFLDYSAGGWAVTAGTGDILRINNPGAVSVTFSIWIGGLG